MALCRFCRSCGYCRFGDKAYTGFLCLLEEGFDGDSGSVGAEAFVVLLITSRFIIAGVEAGNAVIVITARLAQRICECKAQITPIVVACSDIDAAGFDSLGDKFDVIGNGLLGGWRVGGTLCLAGM